MVKGYRELILSVVQVRVFTFLCLHIGPSCFCSFSRQYSYLDYVGCLTYPTFDFKPYKNSHTMHESIKFQKLCKISRIRQIRNN